MKALTTVCSVFLVGLSLTGCLKSRMQLREEADDKEAAKPVPAQVQEVHPGGYVLDEIKNEITRINGRVEELERAKADPSAAGVHKEDFKKLEARIIELEQAQAKLIEAVQKVKETTPMTASELAGLFERGKNAFDDEDYDQAIEDFNSYLKNPKAPNMEEATFYRAECYYKQKQYKKAIVDYSRFPEKFTRSKRMPAALLRIAGSFEALGMKEDAKGFYQELIEKFPKSAEAKKARAKVK